MHVARVAWVQHTRSGTPGAVSRVTPALAGSEAERACSGMSKRYLVTLTEDERAALGQRLAAGSGPARDLTHARVLLKADAGPAGPAWTDAAIAGALTSAAPGAENGLSMRVRRPPRAGAS